ncbi:MAG: Rho termination factor N-terminal domain-containing protein, partial [Clostridiales bacterium]
MDINNQSKVMYDIIELSRKLLPDLKEIAKELDIKKIESYKKQDLIYKILDHQAIKASEKKPEEKKLRSPRDLGQPKQEGSVLNKLFGFRKEEKRVEATEEPAVEKAEPEATIVTPPSEPRREG